jgi:hypothetical protein
MVRGAPVKAANALRIEVFRNDVPAAESRREMSRARMRVMGEYGGFDGESMRLLDVSDTDVARVGVDVTNEYMNRAPASDASLTITSTAVQEETGLIFLSSTYDELRECRAKAIETIDQLDRYKCSCMERFGSRVWPSLNVCREAVRGSVLYVGILGTQYGSVKPESGKSYTELEYDEAGGAGIPRLMFLTAKAPSDAESNGGAHAADTRQEAFIRRVRQDLQCTRFDGPSDLATKIAVAVSNWEKGSGRVGRDRAAPKAAETAREGLLEQIEDGAVAFPRVMEAITTIGTAMRDLHSRMNDVAATAGSYDVASNPMEALRKLRELVETIAAKVDAVTGAITDRLPAVKKDLRAVGDVIQRLAGTAPPGSEFAKTLIALEGVVSAGLESMEEYRATAVSAKALSSILDVAVTRYAAALDDYMTVLAVFRVACLKATRRERARTL